MCVRAMSQFLKTLQRDHKRKQAQKALVFNNSVQFHKARVTPLGCAFKLAACATRHALPSRPGKVQARYVWLPPGCFGIRLRCEDTDKALAQSLAQSGGLGGAAIRSLLLAEIPLILGKEGRPGLG